MEGNRLCTCNIAPATAISPKEHELLLTVAPATTVLATTKQRLPKGFQEPARWPLGANVPPKEYNSILEKSLVLVDAPLSLPVRNEEAHEDEVLVEWKARTKASP